jgi:Uma2 family endonuclease
LAAPPHLIAEVLGGTLHTQPRPAVRHARAAFKLSGTLGPRFDGDDPASREWILLFEPELHLGSEPDIVVPDMAGWRRSTLAQLPDAAFLTVAPDWVCEVLSPSTCRIDRVLKMPIYRREQVRHVWLMDPEAKTLEIFRLDGANYSLIATHGEEERVRAEPFDAIEIALGSLWLR